MDEPLMLDSQHVADLLCVSTRTLWRLVKRGQFPQPLRFNRKLVRWNAVDVRAWVEARKEKR